MTILVIMRVMQCQITTTTGQQLGVEEPGTPETWGRRHGLSNSKLVKMERLPGDCFFRLCGKGEAPADSGPHQEVSVEHIYVTGMSRKVQMDAGNICQSLRVS